MVWDSRLAARARMYANAILTVVEGSGYPTSIRCTPTLDEHSHTVSFEGLAADWTGPAALLFHRHNARLEDQYQLLIRGELVREGSSVKLVPSAFVTANGSRTTDRMPDAGAPLQLLRFLLLGRRLARQYLAKHNPAPWPIGFDELVRIAEESSAGYDAGL